jgi:antitoxin ParD1/3/4
MPLPTTMNVSLTPELAAFVQGRVATGRYRSASEVVRAALRLLEEAERGRERLSATRGEATAEGRRSGR